MTLVFVRLLCFCENEPCFLEMWLNSAPSQQFVYLHALVCVLPLYTDAHLFAYQHVYVLHMNRWLVYQAALASWLHSLHTEEVLPCVWIAVIAVRWKTLMQLVKNGTLKTCTITLSSSRAKKTHHAMHSSSHQASDQQTSSNQSKLLNN